MVLRALRTKSEPQKQKCKDVLSYLLFEDAYVKLKDNTSQQGYKHV